MTLSSEPTAAIVLLLGVAYSVRLPKTSRGPTNRIDRVMERRMNWLILCAAVTLCGVSETSATTKDHGFPDGTLLFLENASSAVELTTRGQIGHVALVFNDRDVAWVYEATPAKVRRVTLDEYKGELARLNRGRDEENQIRTWILRPAIAYQADEAARMRAFVDEQLGRRYSVKNYVRGQPYDGIHCAELASSTLNQSGRYAFERCHKIHPQALYTAVLPTHAAPVALDLAPPAAKEPWRLRAHRRWSQWSTWCGWSFREAWLFCW